MTNLLKLIHMIALVLVIVGALNWGLVGIAGVNLVAKLFTSAALQNIIYALIGLSGLALLFTSFSDRCGYTR